MGLEYHTIKLVPKGENCRFVGKVYIRSGTTLGTEVGVAGGKIEVGEIFRREGGELLEEYFFGDIWGEVTNDNLGLVEFPFNSLGYFLLRTIHGYRMALSRRVRNLSRASFVHETVSESIHSNSYFRGVALIRVTKDHVIPDRSRTCIKLLRGPKRTENADLLLVPPNFDR